MFAHNCALNYDTIIVSEDSVFCIAISVIIFTSARGSSHFIYVVPYKA